MSEASSVHVDLDGNPVEFTSDQLFFQVAEEVKHRLSPDRVVTEIVVDGKPIDLEEEGRIHSQAVSGFGKLSFRSTPVSALLKESLELAPQVCQALILDCEDIESLFAEENLTDANNRIAEMSSLVDWLLQVIASLQSYGSENFRDMSFSGTTVLESVKKMESLLLELHGYLETGNVEDFRRVLKTDFRAHTQQWQELFTEASKSWTPRPSVRAS